MGSFFARRSRRTHGAVVWVCWCARARIVAGPADHTRSSGFRVAESLEKQCWTPQTLALPRYCQENSCESLRMRRRSVMCCRGQGTSRGSVKVVLARKQQQTIFKRRGEGAEMGEALGAPLQPSSAPFQAARPVIPIGPAPPMAALRSRDPCLLCVRCCGRSESMIVLPPSPLDPADRPSPIR